MDALYRSVAKGQYYSYYPTEYNKLGCQLEKNTGLIFDGRYEPSGLVTTEGQMRSDSGVLAHMQGMPSYFSYGPSSDLLRTFTVQGWTRPTINWSLQCEEQGMSRLEGYEAAKTDIGRALKTEQLKWIGISMCIIFTLTVAVHLFFGFF